MVRCTFHHSKTFLSSKQDIFINDNVKCFVTFSSGSPSLFYSIKSLPSVWTEYNSLSMNVNNIANSVNVSSIYSIYNSNKNHFILGRGTKIDLLANGRLYKTCKFLNWKMT